MQQNNVYFIPNYVGSSSLSSMQTLKLYVFLLYHQYYNMLDQVSFWGGAGSIRLSLLASQGVTSMVAVHALD